MKKPILSILALSLFLVSCGGREPRHFAVTHPSDSSMDCAGISREWNANEDLISSIAQDNNNKIGKNIVAGAASLIFFPAVFFMDVKGAEKAELIALRARARVLNELNAQKKCKPLPSKLGDFYEKWDESQK